ncbi:heavy-metal-associated domain-containing protein [Deinococcus sp. QL22]|uniref:heavy-metal-associated domain-containing protein n=1 Tax=Deinococcus sp. QL22 TaxID=2939437 RepID=UPI00353009BE
MAISASAFGAAPTQLDYFVEGIDCPNCVRKIEGALERTPGAIHAVANLSSSMKSPLFMGHSSAPVSQGTWLLPWRGENRCWSFTGPKASAHAAGDRPRAKSFVGAPFRSARSKP